MSMLLHSNDPLSQHSSLTTKLYRSTLTVWAARVLENLRTNTMATDNDSYNDIIEPNILNNSDGNQSSDDYEYAEPKPIQVFDYMKYLPESYRQAIIILFNYVVFIIWIVSLLGNTLVILVLMKKQNRSFSTSIYLKGLALTDLLLNTSNTVIHYFNAHGYIKPAESNADCRVRNVFQFAIVFIATWMLVVISIERVISVWMPYKVKRLCTVRRAYVVIAFLWVIFFGLAFCHESLMIYKPATGCQLSPKYGDFYFHYLAWVLITLKYLIPYAIIFTCTSIIMATLVNRKIRKHSTETTNRGTSVNIVLINVNIVFLVTNSPYIFFYLFFDYYSFHSNLWISVSFHKFWNIYLLILNDCNSAVNVFVYFLVGSKFRKDVKELLCGCFKKDQPYLSSEGRRNLKTPQTDSSKVDCNTSAMEKVCRRQNSEFTM